MRRAMMTLMGLSLVLAGTATNAPASYSYDVSLSVPGKAGPGPGIVTATGTITVDTLGGNLSQDDVTSYSITLSALGGAPMTLTRANSRLGLTGPDVRLDADADAIRLTVPTAGDEFAITTTTANSLGYNLY